MEAAPFERMARFFFVNAMGCPTEAAVRTPPALRFSARN
jgi:hypothetical protein